MCPSRLPASLCEKKKQTNKHKQSVEEQQKQYSPIVGELTTNVLKATFRRAQFERPQKAICVFEVGSDSVDFVNEIFNADDAMFAKLLFDHHVVNDRFALRAHFGVAAFVDQITHTLERRIAISDVRLDQSQHWHCCRRQTHKNAVVQLPQAQQTQNFAHTRAHTVDTAFNIHVSTRNENKMKLES